MINLAVFCDFKQGSLTNNSKSLLDYISILVKKNTNITVNLYTFQEINSCQIASSLHIENISSYLVDSNVYFSTNASLEQLILHLKVNNITHIFCTKSAINDLICSKLSMILNFNLITNIKSFKIENGLMYFSKSIFSGKALANMHGSSDPCIAIFPKGFSGDLSEKDSEELKDINIERIVSSYISTSKIIDETKIQNEVQLSEADIVVGAGRGLKDPNNWGIIEKLALTLKAATACSKPVSDLNWRPHHEHVGQTGIKINPKLYIACGVSGAIQHLAGVNGSRTIVVINNDPDAPFIKHADYIILGDLFEVVPELTKLLHEV
jgi:electron transfer flavoprotein alpha subunit